MSYLGNAGTSAIVKNNYFCMIFCFFFAKICEKNYKILIFVQSYREEMLRGLTDGTSCCVVQVGSLNIALVAMLKNITIFFHSELTI